jgi:hypothetical protein
MFWTIALIATVGCLTARERINRRALVGGIALAACMLGLQSCADAKAFTRYAGPIGQAYVGFALDDQGHVPSGCTASKFSLGDPIHLTLQVTGAPEASVLRVAVRDVVTQRIAWSEDRALTAGESRVTFGIGRKLGLGRYRVESTLGATMTSSRDFLVHDRYADGLTR